MHFPTPHLCFCFILITLVLLHNCALPDSPLECRLPEDRNICYSLRNIQHLERDLKQGWCSEITSVMNTSISSSSDMVGRVIPFASLGNEAGRGAGTSPGSRSRPLVWCQSQAPDSHSEKAQASVQSTRHWGRVEPTFMCDPGQCLDLSELSFPQLKIGNTSFHHQLGGLSETSVNGLNYILDKHGNSTSLFLGKQPQIHCALFDKGDLFHLKKNTTSFFCKTANRSPNPKNKSRTRHSLPSPSSHSPLSFILILENPIKSFSRCRRNAYDLPLLGALPACPPAKAPWPPP